MQLRIAILGLTLNAIQALGAPPLGTGANGVGGVNDLAIRQSIQFPAQCQSACASIENTLNTCDANDEKCLCKKSVERATFNCLECTIQVSGPLNQAQNVEAAQTILNQLIEGCQSAGFTLPATTITSFTEFPSTTIAVTSSESTVLSGTTTAVTGAASGNPGGFSGPSSSSNINAQATPRSTTAVSHGGLGRKALLGAVTWGPIWWMLLFNVALAVPV